MRINYNVSAMLANNALSNNDNLLAKSLERLSSGLKINSAKDNPAGLAMAKRMNAQLKGLSVANQNSSDGISIIETTDGALSEVSNMLQRMNELAVKSSNGTMSDNDRELIQMEVSELKDEIARVSKSTQFNGQTLLDGSFDVKGYTNVEGIKVNTFSSTTTVGEYTIESLKIEDELDENGNPTGNKLVDLNMLVLGNEFPKNAEAEVVDNFLVVKGDGGFEIKLDLNETTAKTYDSLLVQVTDNGSMRLQIGANEGQILAIDIPTISLRNLGIEKVDVSTRDGALDALDQISGGITYISKVRGKLGACQNRLESSISSLDITTENMTAAYSNIMDVNMAEEMTRYTTYQVLTQAGMSMLAQANERPSQVLQLLQ